MRPHMIRGTTRIERHRAPALLPAEWQRVGVRLSDSEPIHAALVSARSETTPEWDMHYGVELGLVMSGRMRRLWRSRQTELGPGQAWYCGIWERHGWQVLEAPCDQLVLVILPEVLVDPGLPAARQCDCLAPFRVEPERRPQVDGSLRQRVLATGQHIVGKLDLPDPMRQLWVRALSFELLLLLQKDWHPPAPQSVPTSGSFESFAEAMELVFRARRRVTTAEAAAACGMSTTTFTRSFTAATGISFARFSLRHRLGEAAAQLLQTSNTLEAVSADWGFTDSSHFHRCFLRHYGRCPGAYRKTGRGDRGARSEASRGSSGKRR